MEHNDWTRAVVQDNTYLVDVVDGRPASEGFRVLRRFWDVVAMLDLHDDFYLFDSLLMCT